MMKKKAMDMMPKFLVILIMSVVLLVFIVSFASNLIRFTDQSLQSYQGFVSKLGDATTADNTYDLILAKKTAVVFFNKDSKMISVPANAVMNVPDPSDVTQPTSTENAGVAYNDAIILRPDSCPTEKSCVCFCKSLKENSGKYTCDGNKCSVFADDFTGNCFADPTKDCNNGILYEREIFNLNYPSTGRFIIHYKKVGDKLDIRQNVLT